jgi:septal ring-binding cell division protein DamX
MRIVKTPATSAVVAATIAGAGAAPPKRNCPFASGEYAKMIGLRATMYAIVKKVTSPPLTSWAIDEPRSEILKYESSMNSAFLILLSGVFATPCAKGCTTLGRCEDLMRYREVTLETTPSATAID